MLTEEQISERNAILFDSTCRCGHHYAKHSHGCEGILGPQWCRVCTCPGFSRREGPITDAPGEEH